MFFLVVDDDGLSQELLALLLGADGHGIAPAASGEEALAKLGKLAPDVILTDVQLPGMAGDQLGQALRVAMPEGTVLLAMSGSQPAEKTFDSYDGFLLKPFSMAKLHATIDALQAGTEGADTNRHTAASLIEWQPGEVSDHGLSVLNEDVYAKLSDSMPGAQLRQMFDMCITDARERLAKMAELAAAGDDAGYRAAAHAIKGGCGFIGATELYCLAETAEHDGLGPELGRKIGTSRTTATFARFSGACERLERILGQRLRDEIGPFQQKVPPSL